MTNKYRASVAWLRFEHEARSGNATAALGVIADALPRYGSSVVTKSMKAALLLLLGPHGYDRFRRRWNGRDLSMGE